MSKTVKARRMVRTGFLNFIRNGMVSIASVLVMSITLAVLTGILLFNHVLTTTLTSVQNKVDVSVYFLPGASEGDILAVQSKVATLPEVADTTYISERDALADFRARHQNDQTTLQALDELDENPIGAMLNIRAKEISQYESISNFFNDGTTLDTRTQSIIDHIDYNKNKDEISAIQGILNKGKFLGILLTVILMTLSVIVTFNTIRLAIYFAREEISVMRLVGASNKQVQGPFIVEGALYGIVATLVTLILFIPITLWFGKNMTGFFQGVNLFKYYLSNIHEFLGILLVFGAGLGALSSVMAARRYLTK